MLDPIDKKIKERIIFTYCQICFNNVNFTCWIKLKCNRSLCCECLISMNNKFECPFCRQYINYRDIIPRRLDTYYPEYYLYLCELSYFQMAQNRMILTGNNIILNNRYQNYRRILYEESDRIAEVEEELHPDGIATPDSEESIEEEEEQKICGMEKDEFIEVMQFLILLFIVSMLMIGLLLYFGKI